MHITTCKKVILVTSGTPATYGYILRWWIASSVVVFADDYFVVSVGGQFGDEIPYAIHEMHAVDDVGSAVAIDISPHGIWFGSSRFRNMF